MSSSALGDGGYGPKGAGGDTPDQDTDATDAIESSAAQAGTATFAPGTQVRIRHEQWLVKQVTSTRYDGWMLEVIGTSPLVRGTEAVFYQCLDDIKVLDPNKTTLIGDDSPHHRRARLYLEAIVRKTALPQTEHGLALADGFLMDRQIHQLRPAELALSMKNPQPRILIADVVGLGKTLEIGILLAELIRRGRGERILVATPAHVLEQFQRELWSRFSIPLVRLDSTGIQRIQQDIPAGRNPFAYFKRAIISVDTLKSDLYAHHLENTAWDAVVIDEAHNLVNRSSRNNALARLLAHRTDALVLASATPHSGATRSFPELIRMLDEAAIADADSYQVKDLEHLYIRRTKTDPEVRDGLKGEWVDRGPSQSVTVPATPEETAVFEELAKRWIPRDGEAVSPVAVQLDAYGLFKAFLSSHKALLETIGTRTETLDKALAAQPTDSVRTRERAALDDLRSLAERIEDESAAKLQALVRELKELGVGPGSDTRVVIFSERFATLTWLAETVPALLGFKTGKVEPQEEKVRPWAIYKGAVQVMHSKATGNEEQKRIVEKFGLREDPVRLLFTGDIASEGVNLHHQCHQLVHYDLPWSLIRIEQRNGRIDRYGQRSAPRFRALILTSDVEWRTDPETGEPKYLDDRMVGAKLLEREEEAHRIEGSVQAVTGLHNGKEEEDRLTRDLVKGERVERSLAKSAAERGPRRGVMSRLAGNVGAAPVGREVPRATVPRLFESTEAYFDEALRQICPTGPENELGLRRDDNGTIALDTPADLQYRFKALPASYLKERGIMSTRKAPGRLVLTFDRALAEESLKAARNEATTQWPQVGFVSDVHPVLDWITDKALAGLKYDEAFVMAYSPDPWAARKQEPRLAGALDEPIYLVQGVYSNALGRPTVVEWMAVMGLPGDPFVVPMDEDLLRLCGVGPKMPGSTDPEGLPELQALVPRAIAEAGRHVAEREKAYADRIEKVLAPYEKRVEHWEKQALFAVPTGKAKEQVHHTAIHRKQLTTSLRTSGAPMLRLLGVLQPLAAQGFDR